MPDQPFILKTLPVYFNKVLKYHGLVNELQEEKFKQFSVTGFEQWNMLQKINNCFSNNARGDIIDRTEFSKCPVNYHKTRTWSVPTSNILSLDDCFRLRVTELTSTNQKINLFWSGGIDSTSVLIGFLKHCNNINQLRIIYSTASMKENPGFFLELVSIPELEMLEFGGSVYLTQELDGTFVSADAADELTASLDESFFKDITYEGLHKPWEDFFYNRTKNTDLIDFCKSWFEVSGRPIETILQARWWFYTTCKIQKYTADRNDILNDNQPLVVGFYDTPEFEAYTYFRIDSLMVNKNYKSYKQFLKDYIYDFNKDISYLRDKSKQNSVQLGLYADKRLVLNFNKYIMLLSDGTRIRTPSLPLLSEKEYRDTYGDSLNYLFNI